MLFILKAMTYAARRITKVRTTLARKLTCRASRKACKLRLAAGEVCAHGVDAEIAMRDQHEAELETLRTKQAKTRELFRCAVADTERALFNAAEAKQVKAYKYAQYTHG